jgi:hypothetical protein
MTVVGIAVWAAGGDPLRGSERGWWPGRSAAAGLVDLADVPGEVDEGPLGLAGCESAAGESAGSSMCLGVSEAAFDEPTPLLVVTVMGRVSEPGGHGVSCRCSLGCGLGEPRWWRSDPAALVTGSDQ